MKLHKLYKLTDKKGRTYHEYLYGIPWTRHSKPVKEKPQLCTEDVFHAYRDLDMAFLLNPIHGNYKIPTPWEIQGDIVVETWDKLGSFNQIVVGKIEPPNWVGSKEEPKIRIMFAILCAEAMLPVYEDYGELIPFLYDILGKVRGVIEKVEWDYKVLLRYETVVEREAMKARGSSLRCILLAILGIINATMLFIHATHDLATGVKREYDFIHNDASIYTSGKEAAQAIMDIDDAYTSIFIGAIMGGRIVSWSKKYKGLKFRMNYTELAKQAIAMFHSSEEGTGNAV